jgi:hypothetical protein
MHYLCNLKYSIEQISMLTNDPMELFQVPRTNQSTQLFDINQQQVSAEDVQCALRAKGFSSVQLDIRKKEPFEMVCSSLRVVNSKPNRSILKDLQLQSELVSLINFSIVLENCAFVIQSNYTISFEI